MTENRIPKLGYPVLLLYSQSLRINIKRDLSYHRHIPFSANYFLLD